jgi:anti-sigma factor RsiW
MNCRKCKQQLSAYVDDRLDGDTRAAIEAHVDGCDECARQLRLTRASSLALRAEPVAQPPSDLAARAARAALTAGDEARDKRSFIERWIPIAAPTAVLAAVAAAVLFAMTPSPDPTPGISASSTDPAGLVTDSDEDIAGDILAIGGE